MDDLFPAIVLGIVEGLTEFIPVSSTGHLILIGDALKVQGHHPEVFDVFIQLGAILAVVVLFFRRFLGMLLPDAAAADDRGFAGLSAMMKIAVACVPAFVAGGLLHKVIKERLFCPETVAAALIGGAVLMIVVERLDVFPRARKLSDITGRQSLFVGLMQCLALWPGMSRSASTIVGGMLSGVERRTAAEFSFLVAVPVMFGAVAFDLYKSLPFLVAGDVPFYAAGFITSFITGAVAIRIFLDLLRHFTLVPFALYRIVVGFLVLLLR